MLAVVKETTGSGYVLKEVPTPEPKDGEVLIRVEAVGICGSDLPIFSGHRAVPLPFIPGHEFAGTIVSKGHHVEQYEVGDRVAPGLVIHCGECMPCRRGQESLCDRIVETGIHVDGAFAEYVTVPGKVLHPLPETLTFADGASIDPVASAYRPIKKAGIGSEDIVVVFGPGPIGIYAAQIARVEGARRTFVVGLSQDRERLNMVDSLGLEPVEAIPGTSLVDQIRDLTGGILPRVVVEATGNPAVYSTCLDVVDKGGKLVVAGIVHDLSTISFAQIVRREIIIEGSICYTWKEFGESLQLVADGRVQVQPLITHHLPLTDIGTGLQLLQEKKAVKVMLYPHGME